MPSIKIEGMSCNHCVMAVTKTLEKIDGVSDVSVDLGAGVANYNETKPVDESLLRSEIEKAGYKVV